LNRIFYPRQTFQTATLPPARSLVAEAPIIEMHLARSSVRQPGHHRGAEWRASGTRWRRNADLADPQDFAKSFQIDGRGHQQRNVADLAGPAALHDNALEVEVRMLALDPPIPPGLDLGLDLLVQVRHRARAASARSCRVRISCRPLMRS
jgi:hypothetical protein